MFGLFAVSAPTNRRLPRCVLAHAGFSKTGNLGEPKAVKLYIKID